MSLVPTGWTAGAGGGGGSDLNFLDMIEAAGGLTSIAFALDAGDATSYDGSSQLWNDLSGNNNNFYRGLTAGSSTSDPSFIGDAGGLSDGEYFSLDGGDFFIEANSHTFAETWHKDNAAFTLFLVIYVPTVSTATTFFFNTCSATASERGIAFYTLYDDNSLWLSIGSGGASVNAFNSIVLDANLILVEDSWNFVALAMTESVLTRTWRVNQYTATGNTSGYSSPASTASSDPYTICGSSTGNATPAAGHRIACIGAVNRAWSVAEIEALYDLVKVRFTTIP